jgi:hypothetical protein
MRTALLVPATFLFILPLQAIDISVSNVGASTCGGPDGEISFEIVGGIPPFTITLFDGGGGVVQEFGSSMTFHYLDELLPGIYSIGVVDGLEDEASTDIIEVGVSGGGGTFSLQSIANCPGEPPIALVNMIENGIVDIWGPDVINSSQQVDLCGQFTYRALMFAEYGSYPLQYEDVNGCILDAWAYLDAPEVLPTMQVVGVNGSCSNGANGSITVVFGSIYQFPRAVTRLKNSAGVVVAGACPAGGVDLTTLIGTPYTFTGLAPDTYWVHVSGQTFNFNFTNWYDYVCRDSIEVVVPELPGLCGVVNGRVFVDNNSNCAVNAGENNVPGTVVRLEPGPLYASTNSNGQYSAQVPYGTYEVFAEHPVLDQSCPVVQVVEQAVHNNVNVPMAPGAQLDMQVSMTDGAARPGFEYQMSVLVNNLTASPAGTVTLELEHDALLGLVSATPAPTTTVGNTLTWSGGTFSFTNAFQGRTVVLRFQVPPDVSLLGTDLITTATVSTTNADADLSNNTFVLERTITGAYDPNDKLANTSLGSGSQWMVGQDEWIDYTIRFQNTGTDTAFTVLITDTLPANLDPGTIVWGAASHAHTRSLEGQGVLKFLFPNILLPDSNVNEPLSHGFVGFRIRPHLPLLPGDEIENIANIYFDFNPPVITEPSVLVAESSTEVVEAETTNRGLRIYPNPANQQVWIQVLDDSIAELELFSLDGRRVLQQAVWDRTITLDVSPFPAGAYMVRVRLSNGSFQHANLIKH